MSTAIRSVLRIKVVDDFSDTPGGRLRSDGPNSGEAFREEHLLPAFAQCGPDQLVEIDLDGTFGYPISFLHEAFGGLAQELGVSEVLSRLRLVSVEAPHFIERIVRCIVEASDEVKVLPIGSPGGDPRAQDALDEVERRREAVCRAFCSPILDPAKIKALRDNLEELCKQLDSGPGGYPLLRVDHRMVPVRHDCPVEGDGADAHPYKVALNNGAGGEPTPSVQQDPTSRPTVTNDEGAGS